MPHDEASNLYRTIRKGLGAVAFVSPIYTVDNTIHVHKT